MDIDFDDLLVSSKPPPTKTSKFAPKNSKFKPVAKPKLEPKPSLIPSFESNPAAAPKVELDDTNPPPPSQFIAEIEQPSHTVDNANGSVDMDTEPMDIDLGNDKLHEEEEDPVVREIDVFFSSSVDANSKLYVLQYPLRPCWRPYELEESCEKVRVKPETAEVELEMSVQVESENYDADDDKAMPKQVLASAWQPPTSARYAVGILIGNELHLNSVHAVVQLRPSMQHLKRQLPSKEMITSADIKKEKAVKQPQKQSKQPGVVNEQNTDAKEQWVPLNYHGEASQLSRQYMGNMVAQQTSQIQFSMSQSDYIDSLCPATSNKVGPKLSSRSALLKLPLEERYKTQFLEGPPVHRFNALKHIAPNDSNEDIFKVLQTHAHLVQGLWVAKSRLKYGRDDGKEVLLRNYAMLQFSKSPIFQETQLPKATQLSESMKGILDEFATRRVSCRDWKFRECTDDSFIKDYSKVVEEQMEIWNHMETRIMDALFPKSSKHSIGDRRPISSHTNDVTPKTTNVPPSGSSSVMLDETREALPRALQKLFQSYKVCSLNQIRQKLRDMAVSENTLRKDSREARAAAVAADAPQEELQRTLNQVAVNIHGAYVSKSSPDHPQYDQLRKIVIDLFLAAGPDGKLKKASIFEAGNVKLQRQITTGEYQKVLNELCISRNSAWVLKSGDSPT